MQLVFRREHRRIILPEWSIYYPINLERMYRITIITPTRATVPQYIFLFLSTSPVELHHSHSSVSILGLSLKEDYLHLF